MQVDVGQQEAKLLAPCGVPTFVSDQMPSSETPAFKPFLDQPKYSPVGHSGAGETAASTRGSRYRRTRGCRHPAPSSPASGRSRPLTHPTLDAGLRCRSRPIREAPKVHLIYLIEDGDHGLLNDLVLQGRDAQRPLSTVGFRVYTLFVDGCALIRAPVYPAMKILDADPSTPASYSCQVTPSTPGAALTL